MIEFSTTIEFVYVLIMLTDMPHLDCCSAGDLRRANGLLARYGFVLREGGNPSVSVYNLLMKVRH